MLDIVFLWAVASADTYIALVVALVLLQFASNFAQGPFQGYVPDLVPARQVGQASGLMGVMIIFGGIVGVGIAGLGYLQLQPNMADATGARDPVPGRPSPWASWRPRPWSCWHSPSTRAAPPCHARADRGRASPSPRGASDILHERSYVWLLVSRLCYLALPGVISAYAVFVLERSFGLPPELAAPYLIVTGLIIALIDRRGNNPGRPTVRSHRA